MAKLVSKKSADRWNNAARIIAQNGAGSRHVRGIYREPRRGACPDIPLPGNYPAVAGATIAAGAVGPIVYGGRVYSVKNHSGCAVRIGHRVGFYVSPKCDAIFSTCVCCDEPGPDCCERFIAVCVGGDVRVMAVDGAEERWTFASGYTSPFCCAETCGAGSYLRVWLECFEGAITANWQFVCYSGNSGLENPKISAGTLDWSALCSGPAEIEDSVTVDGWSGDCMLTIVAATEATSELCHPCGQEPEPEGCCDKLLWFCLNGESVQLPVDGGDHTFDVSSCCDNCTTATLRIRLQCNPETDVVTLQWDFVCNGGTPESGATNTEMSMFCSSNDPRTIDIGGGDVPCFLQLQVSINDAGCDDCGPIIEDPPPPL